MLTSSCPKITIPTASVSKSFHTAVFNTTDKSYASTSTQTVPNCHLSAVMCSCNNVSDLTSEIDILFTRITTHTQLRTPPIRVHRMQMSPTPFKICDDKEFLEQRKMTKYDNCSARAVIRTITKWPIKHYQRRGQN